MRDVRVLVAEDEQSLRELLDVSLQLTGALVTVTSSVAEALAALDRVRPQVVLFNVGLEDGALPLAKATQDRNIPTIALTDRLDDGARGVLLRGHGAALVRVFDHVAVASAVDTAIKAV